MKIYLLPSAIAFLALLPMKPQRAAVLLVIALAMILMNNQADAHEQRRDHVARPIDPHPSGRYVDPAYAPDPREWHHHRHDHRGITIYPRPRTEADCVYERMLGRDC